LVTNTQIGMEINIRQGSASGPVVYTETQTPTTNANGLVSIEIGGGAGFNTIDWSAGPYFIETKTDPTGGTNYTITGTSQLLSVPYALFAKTADIVTGGITETDPTFASSQAAKITAADITNLSNLSGVNTGDQDLSALATKIALGDSTAQVRSEIPDVSGFLTSETDPVFTTWDKSTGISITESQISDLKSYAIATHSHTATEISSGTISIDRLPTGTTASTVALGNHTHSMFITPPGVISQYAGTTAPDGYLLCQGQEVSRVDYADLFAVIGITYGAGDGSTTFNLPDLRQRVPVGLNSTGTFNALNNTGGSETHTITNDQLPSHTHSFSATSSSDGAHTHPISLTSGADGNHNHGGFTNNGTNDGTHSHTLGGGMYAPDVTGNWGGTFWVNNGSGGLTVPTTNSAHRHVIASSGSHTHPVSGNTGAASTNHTHTVSGTTGSTGSGNAIPIVQPYIVLNYIIKY